MRGSNVPTASSVLAEAGDRGSSVVGGDLAGNHLNVAEFAGPAAGTGAVKAGSVLLALAAVLAGVAGAPVHQLVAVGAGEPDLAVALVVPVEVLAGGLVPAGTAVAGVYPALAVGAGEPVRTVAGVVVDSVLADSSVHTGAQRTVFIVGFTEGSAKS